MSIATALIPLVLLGAEALEEAVQARLAPFVGEVLDRVGIDVRDDADVVLAPARRLFVNADHRRDDVRLSHQSPGNCPVHQMPCLVPADTQQPGGAFYVALLSARRSPGARRAW